ncbi:hypothetical protein M758_UG325800 [Ceratodon purpureus]|nr:hypothetical protein M758_UG325800 [Ceratodon purpureus]
MPGSCKSIDDDDDAAKLMPRVAQLIRKDSESLESNGSTSMSLCRSSGRGKIETQIAKPSQQRRAEAILRNVASKFFRKGAIGKRFIGTCKPSALDTLSSHYSSSANRRNPYLFDKKNLRPKASTLVEQGALPAIQQKIARDTSQKAARELRKIPTRSVVKLGQWRTVNSKIMGAVKSNTHMVPEHLSSRGTTVTLPTASHSSQGSEGSCYVSNLAAKSRRGKVRLFMKTTPLSLSELQEKFAELDGEALEEEEVSIAHLTSTRSVLASDTVLQHADDIPENFVDNRNVNRREDEAGAALNSKIKEATVPNFSYEQGQGGSTSQSKYMSKTPGREQDVQEPKSIFQGNARGNVAARSGTDCDVITSPEIQPSHPGCLTLDDPRVTLSKAFSGRQGSKGSNHYSSRVAPQQQFEVKLLRKGTELEPSEEQFMRVNEVDIEMKEGLGVHPILINLTLHSGVVSQHVNEVERDDVKCRDGGNPPHFEDSPESPSVNGMGDKARTVDTKTSAIPLDASAQEFSRKGISICGVYELEHAEGSCNDKRGYSPLKPNEESAKKMTADGPDENASNREGTVHGHTSSFGQSTPSKAKRLSKQDGVSDVPLQEETHSTRGTSATPPRNPLKLTCKLQCSRIGRSTDISQRRLVFGSSSGSLSKQKIVERNSDDVSVSSVKFEGIIHPAVSILPNVRLFMGKVPYP